ncbi:MAG: phospholipase [Chloroflexi bacterium RBG_16_48_8]|nr:MAG: phospholipase [Chloroflexi bacterium RBG_16_48_8]
MECGTHSKELRYLLYLPSKYGEDPDKKWPMILYLHGIGERGSKLNLLKKHGIPKVVENRDDFPFLTVSPQCPDNTLWFEHYDELIAILDEVMETYDIDANRIYLTGNSMGGYGTWGLAIKIPYRFAAIAPICGGGIPEQVCVLKEVPMWAFHGEKDDLVDLSEGQKMMDALEACGGKVRFTIYKGVGHDSWTRTYENPELYAWFLEHTR